ncbi:DUF262 domain-containing HNH endonuclease family protein [Vibrio mediterranei]|uniref:DUF262 domain-containing protein n=1 Tax=Vibrio mediterranei TaxID=689 RepID=UPI001EFC7603|nr:DUF262 domain-containing protein [Vibrio mediterranei]MCG9665925.1 DUF262 domain-containing HNH endonuclease family protein [Vibrio mediterranei]
MKHKVIPSHYFIAKDQSLVSLVCQGKSQFIIPYNQRPWSWKDKQINDLWHDLKKTTNHFYHAEGVNSSWEEREQPIGDPHFLGAFVFEKKGTDYSVVDGQQRLTSITMFVAAIRNGLIKIRENNRGQFKKTVNHYLDNFRSWLIADYSDEVLSTRLRVDTNYSDFFTGYIIEADSEDEREAFIEETETDFSQEPVISSFRKSFDYINNEVESFLSEFGNDELRYKALKALFSTLENCFICIAAEVTKESFSYEVFKCLNAKGLPLSQADKLKNELFTQSKINDHEEIKKFWDIIQENTPYSAVSSFIRIRHVALFGECPDSKLHAVITEKELKNDVPAVIEAWSDDSLLYSYITLHQQPPLKLKFTDDELGYLSDLKTLNNSLSSILTFAAYKKYFKQNRDKFLEILRLTRNFCFRVLTICKKDTGYLELHLGKAARSIMNDVSVKEVRSDLKKASTDNEFEEAFRTASSKNAKQQFFILNAIEEFRLKDSGLQPKAHGEELNVEHILPKKFDKKDPLRANEWKFAKDDPESHAAFVNRLGNLCLLEGEINKDVSSFDYVAKSQSQYPDKYIEKRGGQVRKSYKDSELPGVKILIEEFPNSWGFDVIQERQIKMAETAILVWSLNSPN